MDIRKLSHAIGAAPPTVLGGEDLIKPTKAYRNESFLTGPNAKSIRVLSEMLETETRMAGSGINKTILFFGSARSRSPEDHATAVAQAKAVLGDANASRADKAHAASHLKRLEKTRWMTDVYPKIQDLACRLTQWSMDRMGSDGRMPYAVSTGGGPGLMEAANRGAASVDGALTLGCGISLPFEVGLNKFVTPELAFEHHYFFIRKFSMCYWCRAFVVAPGGYGTCDELFEILTLLQTGKIDFPNLMPVVLFGTTFWKSVVNWQTMVDLGTIAQADVDRLLITDDVEEAYAHITGKLKQWEVASAAAAQEAAAAAEAEHSRLSTAAKRHLTLSQAAASTGARGDSAGRAHKASFAAPPVVTPGGTLDAEAPTPSEIASPPGPAA